MRLELAALSLALSAGTLSGQELLRPSPSGRGSTEVRLAPSRTAGLDAPAGPVTAIKVDYGQPHLRGRILHGDSLVPYDKPWRLGANNATTLSTDVDLVLGGVTVPKGTYVLYALPSRAGWKLVVQRSAGPSAMQYDATNDVGRIDLRMRALSSPIESLTMWLIPSLEPGPARGEFRIAWGTEELSTTWTVK